MICLSSNPKIPAIQSGANFLHQQGITGKNVTVALLDSGLAPHKDIDSRRILHFVDLIHNRKEIYDDYSHGTHVTGILASSRIGIAPKCNVLPIKILDSHGYGSMDTFIEGIKWILYHQAEYCIQIVNISIGGNTQELKSTKNRLNIWVSRMWDAGITVCCSAGNNGPKANSISAPGNCEKVITVGAYDGKPFSSAGPIRPYVDKPEVSAPGYRILSLQPNNHYGIKNGTSMSVPFISGACALLLQKYPYLSNNQIKSCLIQAAEPVKNLSLNQQGAGIVNFHHLLTAPIRI